MARALGGFGAPGGDWSWLSREIASRRNCSCNSAGSGGAASTSGSGSGSGTVEAKRPNILERFPLKAAATAGTLALTGDTIAQFTERYRKKKAAEARAALQKPCCAKKTLAKAEEEFWQHDFVRALRMASYGFLLYGPGSYTWYQFLERQMPAKTTASIAAKVLANQVILGPCVLLVVFAWNFAWMGKAKDIPDKYRRDLWPSLVDGWKFWIPASCINFGIVPLGGRVAYMSTCAIFWNFYLSSCVGKDIPIPAITGATPTLPSAVDPTPAATPTGSAAL